MAFELHTIKPSKGSRKKSKRVGRGNASQKGTYSARGMKGQRARSGGKGGLFRIGFKASLQKVPKVRGFRSLQPKKEVISLTQLEKVASEVEVVTPEILKEMKMVRTADKGVKIVGTGTLTKTVKVVGCSASAKAKEAILKAGGSVE